MTNKESTKSTYWIPESNLENFKASIDKINRKVVKRGFPQFQINIINKEVRESERYIYDDLITYNEMYFQVEVEGELPKIDGEYTLAGVLEKVKEQNLVYCTTKEFMLRVKEMKSRPNYCDHCGSTRKRNKIYVLMNNKGKFVQVGSSCMKDFVIDRSAEYIAHYYESVKDIFEESRRAPTYNEDLEVYPTELVIKHIYHHVKEKGFEGVTGRNPTYKLVNKSIHTDNFNLNIDIEHIKGMISKIREYDNKDEYLTNLNTLLKEPAIRMKDFRFLASFTKAYDTILAKETKVKEEAERAQLASISKHQGEIGEPIGVLLQVTGTGHFDSEYGTRTIVNFRDKDGNFYTWFTGYTNEYMDGSMYDVSATVKDHTKYKGAEVTNLTRCKTLRVGKTESETNMYRLSDALYIILENYNHDGIIQTIQLIQNASNYTAELIIVLRGIDGFITDKYTLSNVEGVLRCTRSSSYNNIIFMDTEFDFNKSKNTVVISPIDITNKLLETVQTIKIKTNFKNKPTPKFLSLYESVKEEEYGTGLFLEHHKSVYIGLDVRTLESILWEHENLLYKEWYTETDYNLDLRNGAKIIEQKQRPYTKRELYGKLFGGEKDE